jgi:hypothetical protein
MTTATKRSPAPRTAAFDADPERYDRWFQRYPSAYHSEQLALEQLLPPSGLGLEIGVGTGHCSSR